jgi:hypothetical protein
LAIALDDVDLVSGTVGNALVPAHCHGTMVERFNEDDSLVGGHDKAVGECLVIKWFASLLKNG